MLPRRLTAILSLLLALAAVPFEAAGGLHASHLDAALSDVPSLCPAPSYPLPDPETPPVTPDTALLVAHGSAPLLPARPDAKPGRRCGVGYLARAPPEPLH